MPSYHSWQGYCTLTIFSELSENNEYCIDRRRQSMIPGLIMWLLGVPLVVIILLFLFRVI
jgi:hypothetical protein